MIFMNLLHIGFTVQANRPDSVACAICLIVGSPVQTALNHHLGSRVAKQQRFFQSGLASKK